MANLLIVEVENGIREILSLLLSDTGGHNVETATSSSEALAKTRHKLPDLITINPMLPDRHGFDLCALLKSSRLTCLTPVIVITSLQETQYREWSFRSGSTAHVLMPFTWSELLNVVEESLRWRTERATCCGRREIVIDVEHEEARLRQTNELIIDVLTLTSLPEDQTGELKQVLLVTGDKLRDWGQKMQCERIASIQSRVERDRIRLAICGQGLAADSHVSHFRVSLDALAQRCGFVELPEGRNQGQLVLERIIQV